VESGSFYPLVPCRSILPRATSHLLTLPVWRVDHKPITPGRNLAYPRTATQKNPIVGKWERYKLYEKRDNNLKAYRRSRRNNQVSPTHANTP
jgi:hypothetical protein